MSVTIESAKVLRAAAAKVRETAGKATRGPWVAYATPDTPDNSDAWTITRPYCEKGLGTPEGCEHDCGVDVLTTGAEGCEEDGVSEGDVEWITLMHPGMAEPLALQLEEAASISRSHERDLTYVGEPEVSYCVECLDEECDGLRIVRAALDVARVILGETYPYPAGMFSDTHPAEVEA